MRDKAIALFDIIRAEEYCNSRSTSLRSFYEAALLVNSAELRRGKDERGLFIRNRIYVIFDIGYICWNLSPVDNGILNYYPNISLKFYDNTEEDFVENMRKIEDSIGFIPADLMSLDILIKNGNFDSDYLRYWIGLDSRHTRKTINSPV